MNNIVFCATQRTGSSLVVDDFCNLLGERQINAEYLTTRLFNLREDNSWDEMWNEVQNSNMVKGFTVIKVMYHYLSYIADFINGINPPDQVKGILEFDAERLKSFYDFFAGATWVHIQRNDVASQAVSVFLARKTNIWERRTLTMASTANIDVPPYDSSYLIRIVDRLRKEAAQWPLCFSHFGIKPIKIEYEQITNLYPLYLTHLFDMVDLKPPFPPPKRRMHKLGDHINRSYADRLRREYNEIRGISL